MTMSVRHMQMARPITSLSSSTGRRSSRSMRRSHHTLLKRTQPRRCLNASALAIASVDNVDAVALAAVIGAIAGSVTTAMKTTTAAAAAAAQTANWGARMTTEVNRQSEEGISAAPPPPAQPAAAHSATSYEAEEAGANPSGYSLALDAMQPAAAAALMCCAARALSNELVRSQDASLVFARAKARACRQFTTSGASPANRGGTTAALEAVQELTTPNALAPLTRNDDDDDDDDDTSIISNASSPMSEITRKYDALVMAMSKDPNAALADESTRSLLEDMAVRVADAAADEFIGNVLMANPSSGAAVAPPPATSLLRDDLHSTRAIERFRNTRLMRLWWRENVEEVHDILEDRYVLWSIAPPPTSANADAPPPLVMPRVLRGSRSVERASLRGARLAVSLLLEMSDVAVPLARRALSRLARLASFVLERGVGAAAGRVWRGFRSA